MESLVKELNELLVRERGLVEASSVLIKELHKTDPDIADSGSDLIETAKWACSGIYHRLNQLNASPSLDTSDLAAQLMGKFDAKAQIALLCKEQKHLADYVMLILKKDSVDDVTRQFLHELVDAQRGSARWCEATLDQWKVDL